MNNSEIILKEIARVWEDCDPALLEKYYDRNIKADYYGYHVTYKDLVNRLHYLKENQTDRKLTILDSISQPQKIAALFHYSAIEIGKGVLELTIMGIYHFGDDGKITQAWAFANKPVNYLEKS